MNKKKLIKALKAFKGKEVVIVDFLENKRTDEEESTKGIYPHFDIELEMVTTTEGKKAIALSFSKPEEEFPSVFDQEKINAQMDRVRAKEMADKVGTIHDVDTAKKIADENRLEKINAQLAIIEAKKIADKNRAQSQKLNKEKNQSAKDPTEREKHVAEFRSNIHPIHYNHALQPKEREAFEKYKRAFIQEFWLADTREETDQKVKAWLGENPEPTKISFMAELMNTYNKTTSEPIHYDPKNYIRKTSFDNFKHLLEPGAELDLVKLVKDDEGYFQWLLEGKLPRGTSEKIDPELLGNCTITRPHTPNRGYSVNRTIKTMLNDKYHPLARKLLDLGIIGPYYSEERPATIKIIESYLNDSRI